MKFKEQAFRLTTLLGAFLLLAPIAFMFIISIYLLITQSKLLIDFLIPLEVFPVVLTGAGILTLIACKTNVYKKEICAMTLLLLVMFVGGQYLAVVTGIADGSTPASDWSLIIVVTTMIVYDILTFFIGIFGIKIYIRLKAPTETK